MYIGVPKEIKNEEYRIGLVPSSVRELVEAGHNVFIETKAGLGVGFVDQDFINAGATVLPTADEVFEKSEMIVKVKEPQPEEIKRLKEHHVLFTYLHLAADKKLTDQLLDTGCMGVAYETVTNSKGGLPLLSPMSEVAGRMSVQVGAHCLEKQQGGAGVLLGGVPGVGSARVVIIGGGVAGTNAARMAMGMEAHVTVIDKSLEQLYALDLRFGSKLKTLYSTTQSIENQVLQADLVIGSVLLPGAAAPKLVSREVVSCMKKGAVMVDISIDQGGCFETSRPTSHSEPTYEVDGVVHYCVTNIPGAVARTSTFALNNATLPYALSLANNGAKQAMLKDPHLKNGLNFHKGKIVHPSVANAFSMDYIESERALEMA